MKRNQVIIIAIAAFVGLWMFSQSGNASTMDCDGVCSNQQLNNTSIFIGD